MPGGKCTRLADLPQPAMEIVEQARRAVLSTIGHGGAPHAVPVCFVVDGDDIVTPIDAKPKRGPEPARIRNIEWEPRATLLFDRWDEEWTRLGWVMVRGDARADEARTDAWKLLRRRYPQYEASFPEPERYVVVTPQSISWWAWEE